MQNSNALTVAPFASLLLVPMSLVSTTSTSPTPQEVLLPAVTFNNVIFSIGSKILLTVSETMSMFHILLTINICLAEIKGLTEFDTSTTKELPPLNIDKQFNLLDEHVSCGAVDAGIKIDVGAKAK